jgi:hypothetical protein
VGRAATLLTNTFCCNEQEKKCLINVMLILDA